MERWLISYADFITLLFAFFVVMYSISSVNEGKYRVLSETLNQAFSQPDANPQGKTLDPLPIGELVRSQEIVPPIEQKQDNSPDPTDSKSDAFHQEQAQMENVKEQLEQVLAPYIQDDLIAVKRESAWIEIEMKSGLLFPSGRAELSLEAVPLLDKLSDIFKTVPNPIQVEGHTDNKPINTHEFPSNWELSAARAVSVVHYLTRAGLDAGRLTATAHGEHHPIADNGSEEGRYKNRRVVIVLQSKAMARYKAPADEKAIAEGLDRTSPPAAKKSAASP